MNVPNVCDVLIRCFLFFFFFSPTQLLPLVLRLGLLLKISQWCLHSTCCIWWQRASQWPCEPVGFPQVAACCTLDSRALGRVGVSVVGAAAPSPCTKCHLFHLDADGKMEIGYKLSLWIALIPTVFSVLDTRPLSLPSIHPSLVSQGIFLFSSACTHLQTTVQSPGETAPSHTK